MFCAQERQRRAMRGPEPGFFDRMVMRVMGTGDSAERKVKTPASREPLCGEHALGEGELKVVVMTGPCSVSCTEGEAWVTRPGRFCDYILDKGESLSLRGAGKVIISGGARGAVVRIVTE